MKKSILVLAALLCTSLWAVAQTDTPNATGQTAGAPSASSSSSSSMTIDGCLSGSAGAYTLTDKLSGTTYNLTGNTAKLADHVGHEVKVTGTASGSSSSASSTASDTSSGSSSAMGASKTISVSSFKHVAATCSASK